jgi:hypothetical protein
MGSSGAAQNTSTKPLDTSPPSGDATKIIKSLNGFYDLVGHKPEEPDTLVKMASYFIAKGISPTMVSAALDRCVQECRYPVRLPDITQRIVGMEVPAVEAEMRAAWDVVVKYVRKWARWNCERSSAYIDADAPKLPQRTLDCVRRSGGWMTYLAMDVKDFPFQQKRFFEEYQAWQAVEPVVKEFAALATKQVQQLTAGKKMESRVQPLESQSQAGDLSTKVGRGVVPRAEREIPRKDPAQEKARLAAWLKDHPEIGAKV